MMMKNLFLIIPLTFVRSDCETVQGCMENDVFYLDGEVVLQYDPCKICNCIGNEVKCSMMTCAKPLPGCVTQKNPEKCCPEILYCGCMIDDKMYEYCADVPSSDPCKYCYCDRNGEVSCDVMTECPEQQEECVYQNSPDQCCPEKLYCGCTNDGQVYHAGEEISSIDSCSYCYCEENGEIRCEMIECPQPQYGCVYYNNPNQCCPEISYCGCMVDGKFYLVGEEVPGPDACTFCFCKAPEVIPCKSKKC
ncbi:CLUMA_CG016521, isoform A [Clunio marinus]|uniref:CLUMA_CG016521, isoform A n=1 Tax=Clunio marinus TaxID=568069 RepID=A0A1J1IWV7_9DIPT|nr:CLUMA_CG016521, isoform A [Clunio marinus]